MSAKKVDAPPSFPTLEAAIRELLGLGIVKVEEIADRLPPGLQPSAGQIAGVLEDILGHAQWAQLRDAALQDVFNLLMTGHSSVKHDPVNMA